MIFHKILVCLKFVVTKLPQQMYCQFLSQNFLFKVFFLQIFFFKKEFLSLNLYTFSEFSFLCVFVRLFVCLSMPLKSPASGGQTKFWSKVLVPVLASDDTILEIFDFNNLNFSVFFEAIKLLSHGQKSRIRETKNLLTDAPSSTAAKKLLSFFSKLGPLGRCFL